MKTEMRINWSRIKVDENYQLSNEEKEDVKRQQIRRGYNNKNCSMESNLMSWRFHGASIHKTLYSYR
jgi:hypothetical protein